MTEKQQIMVTDSMWVVNTVLKKLNQSHNEDLKQMALLYLCHCCIKYDSSLGVKWTTYAYKNVYLYCKRVIKKQREKKRAIANVDPFDVLMYVASPEPEPNNTDFVIKLKKLCTPAEREIIQLKALGYKGFEICNKIHKSQSYLTIKLKSIREKARQINGLDS